MAIFSQFFQYIFESPEKHYQWIFSGAAFFLISLLVAVIRWIRNRVALHDNKGEIYKELREAKIQISKLAKDARAAVNPISFNNYGQTAEAVKKQHAIHFATLKTQIVPSLEQNLLVAAYSRELIKMVTWNELMYAIIDNRCGTAKRPQNFKRNYCNLWAWYANRIGTIIDYAIQCTAQRKRIWDIREKCKPAGIKIAQADVQNYLEQLKISGGNAIFEPRLDCVAKYV